MTLLRDTSYTNSRAGSITLETAISFSLTLILICGVVSVIMFYRTDILMQRSFEQTCEQISLIPPTTVIAADSLSTLVNAIPDGDSNDGDAMANISKVASIIAGINGFTGDTAGDLILEGTMAGYIADSIRAGYIERNGGSDFYAPEFIDVDLSIDNDRHVMEVICNYYIDTLAGRINRNIFAAVPLYGDPILTLNGSKADSESDIWSQDNFTRGDFFREENGSNLPKTFPVIDSFENGEARSTLSIDLTAPTYGSDSSIIKRVRGEIDELAGFDGADVIISGQRYTVRSGDIRSRTLTVVIPSNSDDSSRGTLTMLRSYADANNVDMRIVEYGTSMRYQQ